MKAPGVELRRVSDTSDGDVKRPPSTENTGAAADAGADEDEAVDVDVAVLVAAHVSEAVLEAVAVAVAVVDARHAHAWPAS